VGITDARRKEQHTLNSRRAHGIEQNAATAATAATTTTTAAVGLKHLFTTGLQPIPDVHITYPKTADVKHHDYKPDQVCSRFLLLIPAV
jgi:hypothetical protein